MNNLEVNLNEEDEDRRVCKVDRNESILCSESRGAGIDSSRKASIRDQILHEAEYRRGQKAESSERYGYIYLTTNLINGMMYFGQHKSESFDESYKGSGTLVRRAYDKHGWENFKTEVLEWCQSREELNEREKYWISYYDAVNSPDFYNIAPGGECGPIYLGELNGMYGRHHTEESKEKMRNARQGKSMSKESIEKISKATSGENHHLYGKHHTEESKEKMRQAKLGKKMSEEFCKLRSSMMLGPGNVMYGRHHTEEARRKMSEASANREISDEEIRYRYKRVLCIETGEVFRTISQAIRFIKGIDEHKRVPGGYIEEVKIAARLYFEDIDKNATAFGYHWTYFKEDIKF